MSPHRAEVRKLASLAIPVAATQVSTFLMGFVDTAMVGRVSVEALAAAAIANVWNFGTVMLAHGMVLGIDPIVAQAHGARDGRRCGLALQQGVVVGLVFSVPVALAWTFTDRALVALGQDPLLAAEAQVYSIAKIPGLPFFLMYTALRQYLQGRELVRPALWVILIANVLNAFFNWVLIFGHLGAPALGLLGAGIATSATRALSFGGLLAWMLAFRLHRGAWVAWSPAALDLGGLRRVVALGVPIALATATEMWAFQVVTLLAGTLGATLLAAHAATLNLAGLAFMMPLGISQGATTRVGNLLGAGSPHGAQHAARVALVMGAGVMTVSAFAFVVFRTWLPRIYSPDAEVIAAAAAIMPIAAAFQIFDGTQVVGCGILRGMGRTRPAAAANLVGYWLLGLPAGYLALRSGWGLEGLWWGLCLGLAVVAALLVLWIRYRGPVTARPLALH